MASAAKALAVVRELEARGVRAAAFQADQADPAEVEGLVEAVAERFGRLDILVNSAGVAVGGVVGDPATDVAALDRQLRVNVGGVAAAVRAAAPLMGEGGRIISIGSMVGERVILPGFPTMPRPRRRLLPIREGGRAISGRGASPSTSWRRARSTPT